jgi:RNA polymerase sigma-70 factor (ECF subfamily)
VGYFRRCGINDGVAVELAQDAFVNAYRGLQNFKGQSKLSTWLWTIARNVLLAHVRSNPSTQSIGEPVDPDSLTNGDDAHLNDMRDSIRRGFAAFAREHPERAQVLYLAAVEGWSINELAEFLGRTPHAATEYLSQCRIKLKPYLADCDE